MTDHSTQAIRCLHKDQDCLTDNCFYEKECTEPSFNKHCYAIFKKLNSTGTNKTEILIAGCWSGGDECHPPSYVQKKFENEEKVSYKIPESLLDPRIQEKCIGYARSPDDIGYFAKNNQSFCCCSTSFCNRNIYISNESNPFEMFAKSMNPQTTYNNFSTTKPILSSYQINALLVASLVCMSVLFILLLTILLFKKKLFVLKNKYDLPTILFTNNLNIDSTNFQNGSQPILATNRKDEVMIDSKNQNSQLNEDYKNSTQPLLSVKTESFFPQNIVAPNIDVLPESIFNQNPVIPRFNQNNDLINNNDLKELESFKARLEEQLALSNSKNFSSSEKIDPNMIINPRLIQPSDIYLIEKIAQGQFSSVWKGRCLNSKDIEEKNVPEYAIKIFSGFQKSAWTNEKEIYNSLSTTNEFILTHFNSDILELPKNQQNNNGLPFSSNEYWIITEYHSNGSLNDFLKLNLLSWQQMIRLAHSLLEGLAYLHSENIDPKKQFAIAHRDLKSKNILVKRDGQTCCIGDFGLALKLNNHNKLNSAEIRSKVGTRRYMSPELIEGAIAFSKETFLRIDVYACALVLWEIISRGDFYEERCDYKLPFEEEVGQNPSLEDMKELIVDKSVRPIIKENWLKHHKISSIAQTIEECWDIDLDARISSECAASRIRKIFQSSN